MRRYTIVLLALLVLLVPLLAVAGEVSDVSTEAQQFVDAYSKTWQKLSYDANEAEWASNTKIVEGDTTNAYRTRMADEALAAFTGKAENIEMARKFLAHKDQLDDLLVRQLDIILYQAANNPQTVPKLVKERIKAETAQVESYTGSISRSTENR